jgi:rhamnosyltransferase subunit B
MHVMINALGSSGDVNPFIPLAARLQQDGHQVDFIANPNFEERIKRQGLRFLPLGTQEDYQTALSNPDLFKLEKAFAVTWKLAVQAAKINYDLILKHQTRQNTLLIGSTLALGARLAQEKLGLPFVSVHLAPTLMLSGHDMPQSPTFPLPSWTPPAIKSAFIRFLERVLLDPICLSSLNSLRAELELPPLPGRVFTKWIHSSDLVIGAFPEWFSGAQPDWPPRACASGFSLYTSAFDPPLSEELEQFLDGGTAPLVVTAGTAMAYAAPFLSMGMKAARATGNRAVLVCDFENQVDTGCDPDLLHVRYANFQALFKRAALVVHHGGIGTGAMSLACGTPQLIVPFAHDQFDNAMRFERLGVARMVRRCHDLNEWCASIRKLVGADSLKAASEFANRLTGQPAGADLIVKIINERMNPVSGRFE